MITGACDVCVRINSFLGSRCPQHIQQRTPSASRATRTTSGLATMSLQSNSFSGSISSGSHMDHQILSTSNLPTLAPNDMMDAGDEDDTQGGRKKSKNGKRRKVNHACVYCRRSHMTCDDSRPCKRWCVLLQTSHLYITSSETD